jgi:hypothetical protein
MGEMVFFLCGFVGGWQDSKREWHVHREYEKVGGKSESVWIDIRGQVAERS